MGLKDAVLSVIVAFLVVATPLGIWAIADPRGFSDTMSFVAWVGMRVLAIIVGLGTVSLLLRVGTWAWIWISDARMVHADARERAIESRRTWHSFPGDHQVFSQEANSDLVHAHHLEPRIYSNGHMDEVSEQEEARWHLWAVTRSGKSSRKELEQPFTEGEFSEIEPIPLLEAARGLERPLFAYGLMGSAKTTGLQWIASDFQGKKFVIDIDDDGETWPPDAEVRGWSYEDADEAIEQVLQEIERRRGQRRDQVEYEPTLFVFDEWFWTAAQLEARGLGKANRVAGLMVSGRKLKMYSVFASQTDRVTGMGLKGLGDLVKMSPTLRFYKDEKTNVYSATFSQNGADGEPRRVQLPGPFPGYARIGAPADQKVLPPAEQPPMTGEEARILDLWDGGERYPTRIAKRMWGPNNDGSPQINKVRDVIEKHRGARP